MNRSIRAASSSGNAAMSRKVSMCRSGRTSRWVSAAGAMSRIATNPSAACTWSPSATRRQKRQSGQAATARTPSSATPTARARAPSRRRCRRRATACSRPRSRDPACRAGRRPRCRRDAPARPAGASEAARSRALRSLFAAAGTGSSAAVRVPGRGEYGNTCTLVMPGRATALSVLANARSSSVGKPTITSVVRLKSSSPSIRRGTAPSCSGGPSRGGRRRRRTGAGCGDAATRSASRAWRRSARA